MAAKRRPTFEDAAKAVCVVLTGLSRGRDVFAVADDVARFHPDHDTFPGEVFIGLGADALDEAGATRTTAIAYERVLERFLPECEFRGRDNRKIQFALLVAAALHGGVEPDLLDEVAWWGTDDFWRYALYTAIVWIRAAADHGGITVAALCTQLAERRGISLS